MLGRFEKGQVDALQRWLQNHDPNTKNSYGTAFAARAAALLERFP